MSTTLSSGQLKVVELARQGKSIAEIAETLALCPPTVREYLHKSYKKTGTHKLKDLLAKIAAEGLDGLKNTRLPQTPATRYELINRLRFRDGDNCCLCGHVIEFSQMRKRKYPTGPTFYYQGRCHAEADIKLAHFHCNPLCGEIKKSEAGDPPVEQLVTTYATEQS